MLHDWFWSWIKTIATFFEMLWWSFLRKTMFGVITSQCFFLEHCLFIYAYTYICVISTHNHMISMIHVCMIYVSFSSCIFFMTYKRSLFSFVLSLSPFLFGDRVLLYILGWCKICLASQVSLEILILLPQSLEYWNYWNMPVGLVPRDCFEESSLTVASRFPPKSWWGKRDFLHVSKIIHTFFFHWPPPCHISVNWRNKFQNPKIASLTHAVWAPVAWAASRL